MKNVKHFIACSFILVACSVQVYGSDKYSKQDGELIDFNEEEYNAFRSQQQQANIALVQAAQNKDFQGITKALGLGAYVDYQDELGNTAFHYLENDETFFGTDKQHRKAKAMLVLHQADRKIENKERQTVDEIQNTKIYQHPLYIWMAIQEHKAKELENNSSKSSDSSK